MNKNQALVWITIIVAVLIYSLNSFIHSKDRYLGEIGVLKDSIKFKNQEIDSLKKKGYLLTFEALEVTNAEEYKKNGNISQKVITLQNDNISITRIIDRYSNLKIRNIRAITKYKKVLGTISTEEEERLFKIEQAKITKVEKKKPVKVKEAKKSPEPLLTEDSNSSIKPVIPILEDNNSTIKKE